MHILKTTSNIALFIALVISIAIPSTVVAQQKQERSVREFQSVSLNIQGHIYLKQEANTSVVLQGDPSLLENIETVVEGNTLKIRTKKKWGRWNRSRHGKLNIYLSTPVIEGLKISGSGSITALTPITSTDATCSISGSGKIIIDQIKAKQVTCTISGSGDIQLKGESKSIVKARISGSGNINTAQLITERGSVHITGSGDCRIYASKHLEARVAGSGDIYYYGKPSIDAKTAGSGNIKSMSINKD